jgi:hypothetical protein
MSDTSTLGIDPTIPGTAAWWFDRLLKKLDARRPHYHLLDSYYRNENGIPSTADQNVKESYRRLMAVSKTNWAELVVEAVREREKPVGFRTGAAGDDLGDVEAWRVWQANSLDAGCHSVHRDMLTMGCAYVMVGAVDPDIGAPLITPEDPRECIVETDPARRHKVRAGLKVFRDGSTDWAYLHLPGFLLRFARQTTTDPTTECVEVALNLDGWQLDAADRTGLAVVPIIPFVNRANVAPQGVGEFEPHLSVLNRINYTTLQGLEIATMQAYRQRAVKGVPAKDERGDPIDYDDIFAAGPGALWHLPATAEMWESGQVDLGPVRSLNRDNIQDLAATTGTPLFYLTPDAANGSAEGASLARERLIFRTYDRLTYAGEGWESVIATSFLVEGDMDRARRPAMEIIWWPPELHSLAEQADAAVKGVAGGLSRRAVLRMIYRMTPQEIEDNENDLAAEALTAHGAVLTSEVIGASGPVGEPAPS